MPRNPFYLLWQYTAVLADLVHTTLGKLDNAGLFLRLGLPFTLIRHENGTFRKRCSNRRNLKTPTVRFGVDGKHFEKMLLFKKGWRHNNHVVSLTESSSIKTTGDWCVFKFPWRNVDGKHLMHFESENTVFIEWAHRENLHTYCPNVKCTSLKEIMYLEISRWVGHPLCCSTKQICIKIDRCSKMTCLSTDVLS